MPPMPINTAKTKTATYQQSYDAAIEELSELMTEREEIELRRERIDRRISRLREAIMGLGSLCNKAAFEISRDHPELFPDTASPDVGFTDAIRAVFRDNKEYSYSPIEIRDYLEFTEFDVAKYKNVLASIHSIVKRLKKKGEIIEGTQDGKVVYKCNPRGPLAQDPAPTPAPATSDLSDEDIPF